MHRHCKEINNTNTDAGLLDALGNKAFNNWGVDILLACMHSLPSLRKAAHLLHLISFPAALKAKTESVSITEWTQAADVCVCVVSAGSHEMWHK